MGEIMIGHYKDSVYIHTYIINWWNHFPLHTVHMYVLRISVGPSTCYGYEAMSHSR